MMKQQNYSFVTLVFAIFLLIIFVGNMLGLLYMTEGNIAISLPVSLFLVVCYFFVVDRLKKTKEVMFKKRLMHPSSIFLVFFIILGFISFKLMSHAINIEFNCKEQIQRDALAKIKIVDSMASEYKKRAKIDMLAFEPRLKTKLGDFKDNRNPILRRELTSDPFFVSLVVLSNPDGINIDEVTSAKMRPYQRKIDTNCKLIDDNITANNKKYQSIFDNWKRFQLIPAYSKLSQYVAENGELINTKIAELPLNKQPIDYKPANKNANGPLPLNSPAKLNVIYPPHYSVPIAIILFTHICLLIPFFVWKIPDYNGSSNKSDPLAIENVREI